MINKFNIGRFFYPILMLVALLLASCKKLVEVNPPSTSTNSNLVFNNDATAIAVLTGIYTRMSQNGITNGITSMSLFPGLSADELTLYSEVTDLSYIGYFRNNLTSTITGNDFWNSIYPIIYVTNTAIEGIIESTTLSTNVRSQLLGEAKFIRAFCYFYLTNLYGDVPLALTTDYKTNASLARISATEIYQQIILDLKDAQSLLGEQYLDASMVTTEERVSPNKWAATALLARTYLFTKDYLNAELQATLLINNTSMYDTVPLNNVFLKNNKEAIWQLQSVDNFVTNTSDARYFILPAEGPNIFEHQVYLSDKLKNSFEINDNRKARWLDSVTVDNNVYTFPTKYKNADVFSPVTEYTTILRLSEQYLIRAEARTHLGNINDAISDLNVIRIRAGLLAMSATNKEALITAILHERQVELFTEWGHRWIDLKRTDRANTELLSIKGSNWQATDQLYPIPESEINYNPNLKGHQNPGYN